MAKKKNKLPPLETPKESPDQTLPRGELRFPPSRMDPEGGWVGNPLEHVDPLQKKDGK